MALIEISDVSVSFNNKSKTIIRNANLLINEGDFVGIIGKSGVGKSTLMKVIGGVLSPATGSMKYKDINIYETSEFELAKYRNEEVGFIFQNYGLLPHYSVYDNLVTPLYFSSCKLSEFKRTVNSVVERLNISHLINSKSSVLSGGEKQRVAIARALINNPKVILADEPTSALDEETANEVMSLLKKINESGITVIIVTHDRDLVSCCKRVVRLEGGEIFEEI